MHYKINFLLTHSIKRLWKEYLFGQMCKRRYNFQLNKSWFPTLSDTIHNNYQWNKCHYKNSHTMRRSGVGICYQTSVKEDFQRGNALAEFQRKRGRTRKEGKRIPCKGAQFIKSKKWNTWDPFRITDMLRVDQTRNGRSLPSTVSSLTETSFLGSFVGYTSFSWPINGKALQCYVSPLIFKLHIYSISKSADISNWISFQDLWN